MIVPHPEPISIKDRDSILKWLNTKEAVMFLGTIRSEHAIAVCEAAQILDQNSAEIARGAPVPSAALPFLKRAATLKLVIDQFVERMQLQENQPMTTVKITVE